MCFDDEFDSCAFSWSGVPFTAAPDFFETLLHVEKAVAWAEAQTIHTGSDPLDARFQRETAAIVGHHQHKAIGLEFEGDAHLGGGGMFNYVVQGFFESEENIVADLGGQRPGRKIHWHIQAAANARRAQKLLGETAQV